MPSDGPHQTISPPAAPPSGPRSRTQSAQRTTSRLCSITITVLPASTSVWSAATQPADVDEVQAGRRLVEDVEGLARRRAAGAGSRASRAAPRRPRASSTAGRAARSRARSCRASRGRGGSSGGSRRTRAPPRSSSSRTSSIDLNAVLDLERLGVEALPAADVARHLDVGEELHLDGLHAGAAARLAAAALHVEREPPARVAARLRLRAGSRRGRGSRRTPSCRSPGCCAACGRSATGRSR